MASLHIIGQEYKYEVPEEPPHGSVVFGGGFAFQAYGNGSPDGELIWKSTNGLELKWNRLFTMFGEGGIRLLHVGEDSNGA